MRLVEFKPMEDTDGYVKGMLHSPITAADRVSPSGRKYPSIIICPGGGYDFISDCEMEPVAHEYLAAGYNVFILSYSVKENARNFIPLMELSYTVMKIRECAEEWNCKPDQIAVSGFSAGGHLACSLATMWNHDKLKAKMDTKDGLNRPNAAILSYPVITSGEYAHVPSLERVSGSAQGSNDYNFFSLEKHVSAETCKTFLWHTASDDSVPVENSLLFAMALSKHKIPFEYHVFPEGIHGLSVCTTETRTPHSYNRKWVKLSIQWLDREFGNII